MIDNYIYPAIYFTFSIIIFFLGLIIYRENPKQRINRVTGIMILLACLGTIFGGFGALLNGLKPEVKDELQFLGKGLLLWEFFFPQLVFFSLIYPREQEIFHRIKNKIFLIYLPYIFHFLIVILFTSPEQITNIPLLERFKSLFGVISLPIYYLIKFFLFLTSLLFSFHNKFFAIINILYVITALAFLHFGYKSLKSFQFKKQVGLVIWGLRSSVGIYTIAYLLPMIFSINFNDDLKFLFVAVALLTGTGSIGWAIVRYRFLDIQLILRKSFVFSISSGFLVGIYLLIYNHLKLLSENLLNSNIPFLEIGFIIFAVLLFQPILKTFERWSERIFLGERKNYQNILEEVSRRLLVLMDMSKLVSFLKTEIKNTLMLERVEVFLKIDNKYVIFGNENIYIEKNDDFIRYMRQANNLINFERILSDVESFESIRLIEKLGTNYILTLKYRDKIEGFMCLGNKIYRSEYSFDDITFLHLISNQLITAIENARLYEETIEKEKMKKELNVAREIQNSLLPKNIPVGDKYQISAMNIQSREVGGDYFDVIKIDENKIAIAIGDISGKGVPASLLMSNLQASLRTSIEFMKEYKNSAIDEILSRMNNHLVKSTMPEQYATFFYGLFDTNNNTLIYSNAGHNYPILITNRGDIKMLKKGGMALGFLSDLEYEKDIIKLNKGDSLILYTDGITEAINLIDSEFSEKRLIDIIKENRSKNAQDIKSAVYDKLVNFTNKVSQYDDITLVVLKILKD